jgi:hypothetical protein
MSFFWRLLQVEFGAQLALIACAVLVGVSFTILIFLDPGSKPPAAGDLIVLPGLAWVAYMLGVAPVVLLGAPIYAILEARERATAVASVLIGAIPGLCLIGLSISPLANRANITPVFSLLYLLCGISVGGLTHLIRNWNFRGNRAA